MEFYDRKWTKLGRIVQPRSDVSWLSGGCGPCFAVPENDTGKFYIFIGGRDLKNRSQIGKILINIERPLEILKIDDEPVLTWGDLGSFDENGVSYPYIVSDGLTHYMYYTGWSPSVLTPFRNDIGLATSSDLVTFVRYSKAPIVPKTNEDYLNLGSVGVIQDSPVFWRMYYTSFLKWGEKREDHKHYYVIKYANSEDGINWHRDNKISINLESEDEYSICRPTILKIEGRYHMWFTYRGHHYKIGYAYSDDGISFKRIDNVLGFGHDCDHWESESQCYSHVFMYSGRIYSLYCGNNYGREGIGLAVLD